MSDSSPSPLHMFSHPRFIIVASDGWSSPEMVSDAYPSQRGVAGRTILAGSWLRWFRARPPHSTATQDALPRRELVRDGLERVSLTAWRRGTHLPIWISPEMVSSASPSQCGGVGRISPTGARRRWSPARPLTARRR
jgi:hypothetical protein